MDDWHFYNLNNDITSVFTPTQWNQIYICFYSIVAGCLTAKFCFNTGNTGLTIQSKSKRTPHVYFPTRGNIWFSVMLKAQMGHFAEIYHLLPKNEITEESICL